MTGIDAEWRMTYLAALELSNDDIAFVGIGVPAQAAMLAKRMHAPQLTLVFESGVMDADPDALPLSTGSPSVARGAGVVGSMLDVFGMLQRGCVTQGMLSAAQVDRHGNLNSTVIGDYRTPKVRLPGSGGAHDIACLARQTMILMPHDPRRFVERVDFITSPGLHPERAALGLGMGPTCLVTPRARFSFSAGELTLDATFGEASADEAVAGIPWIVARHEHIQTIPLPDKGVVELARSIGGLS